MPVKHTFGDVINVRPVGSGIPDAKHESLLDTTRTKIKRMVLPEGKELPDHKAPGEITVQCLEGRIEFTTMGKAQELEPGFLICLPKGEMHSVRAMKDSTFLLTIFLDAV